MAMAFNYFSKSLQNKSSMQTYFVCLLFPKEDSEASTGFKKITFEHKIYS